VMQPPEGPPICTALNFLLFFIPPPMVNIISRIEVPITISTSPVSATFPERANTLVPLLVVVPIEANQSAPRDIISGIFDKVSTLLIIVGLRNKPLTAGNGGRGLGIPRFPSIEAIKAVSSPQTNAPAPIFNFMSKSIPVPKIFLPSNPNALAS